MLIVLVLGSPYRHELQENVLESDKKALTWNGENDYYQLMKSVDGGKQPYFPTPPKVVRKVILCFLSVCYFIIRPCTLNYVFHRNYMLFKKLH